jgi:hypothetical protein
MGLREPVPLDMNGKGMQGWRRNYFLGIGRLEGGLNDYK